MNDEDDRISSLPDVILCKILSFLDLKPAIRTSILSKRWKPVWTFLQDFDFDFDVYERGASFHSRYYWKEVLLQSYLRFVNGVLSNRDHSTKIGKFRLAFNTVYVHLIFIRNFVNYAISHNVEDLHLAAYLSPRPFNFPTNLFESWSLYKLRLKNYFDGSLIIPKLICLPSLKILYLECFKFKDEDDFNFSQEPFSCFPNLEELILDCCRIDGLTVLAPELLVLELLFQGYKLRQLSYKVLKVATPKLKSFKFEGPVSLDCPMGELPCLDTVYVDFYPILYSPVKEKMQINLFKLLEQFKNAKTLTLSFRTIEVLSMDSYILQQYHSPFVNLKHLKIVGKPQEKLGGLLSENVMAYLTTASSFSDLIIVENVEAKCSP